MSAASPGPGWYRDPTGRIGERYWDGNAWTVQFRDYPPPGSDVASTSNHGVRGDGFTPPAPALTARQLRVLFFMAEGMTNGQIARVLRLSESTVREETKAIYEVLQVKGRVEAVQYGHSHGLIAES